MAQPTWKLGIRFLWGPRGRFDYTFAPQMDAQWSDLPRPNGFCCDDEFSSVDAASALMREDKVFNRQPNGAPDIQPWHAFHSENKKFVEVLEQIAREVGVEIIDGRVSGAERVDRGISAVHLEDGRTLAADFFIDASGFGSALLGKTLEVPYRSFDKTLFCDREVSQRLLRATVGGQRRGNRQCRRLCRTT